MAERAKLIDLTHRNDSIQKGYPETAGGTVYFSVVDQQGNACSFIVSLKERKENITNGFLTHHSFLLLLLLEFDIHGVWGRYRQKKGGVP